LKSLKVKRSKSLRVKGLRVKVKGYGTPSPHPNGELKKRRMRSLSDNCHPELVSGSHEMLKQVQHDILSLD